MSVTETRPIRSLHLDTDDRPFIVIWETTRACARSSIAPSRC